jgi:predicted AlkP superfamily pyrophosphatase or phosphodiesterase
MYSRARSALLIVAVLLETGVLASSIWGADEKKPESPATRPVAAVRHVIVISCDGLRPDVLLRADAPNLRKMMARGSFTLWARTIPLAVTLPSHTSMLTGVYPEKHGINWNDDEPELGYPKVPTLFALAKKAGYTTSIATGKSKFSTLTKPGTVDWINIPAAVKVAGSTELKAALFEDAAVAKEASDIIASHKPNVMFIHFPGADKIGHSIGWGTPEQLAMVGTIDAGIGKILNTIEAEKLADSTVVIVSADHGGAVKGHGGLAEGKPIDDPRSRMIPWICLGPGIRENYDLTREPGLTVNTVDTFATACWLLAIPPGKVDGKPIKQILAPAGELLHATADKQQ